MCSFQHKNCTCFQYLPSTVSFNSGMKCISFVMRADFLNPALFTCLLACSFPPSCLCRRFVLQPLSAGGETLVSGVVCPSAHAQTKFRLAQQNTFAIGIPLFCIFAF